MLLRRSLWSAALLIGCGVALVAEAAAPQQKTAAPGWYRTMLGDFEVTVLSDGVVDLEPKTLLLGIKPAEVGVLLGKRFLGDKVATSVNTFLVNTGDKLILVDTGAAGLFGPTLGKLPPNLAAAGYRPEQIDAVLITHMHPDHVGGLMADGKLAFPNAIVHADQRDADYWLSDAQMAKAPEAAKGFFKGAMASLKPYVDAGKLKTFRGDTELFPGIRANAAAGHTPGHTTYTIESKGQKLVLWGDLVHVAAVQFPKPSVTIAFDTDTKAAAGERAKAFAAAAKGGWWIGAAHLPFPGIGHIRAEGRAWEFVPANYDVPR